MGVKIIIGRADTHRFSNAVIGHLALYQGGYGLELCS